MTDIDPENPLSIGKRMRTGAVSSIVSKYNDESLARLAPIQSENPLTPPANRRIVTVRRKSTTPSSIVVQKAITVPAGEPVIVAVKGNNKVDRCTRCKTFIKRGVPHTKAECDRRIASKGSHKGVSKGGKRKFRMTPKRRKAMIDMIAKATQGEQAFKTMKSVENWIKKHEGKLTKTSKKLFVKLLEAFTTTDSKKYQSNLRKCGL